VVHACNHRNSEGRLGRKRTEASPGKKLAKLHLNQQFMHWQYTPVTAASVEALVGGSQCKADSRQKWSPT
jgi:hypothetical protein